MFSAFQQEYRHDVINDWKRLGIDALICPVAACVALPDKLIEKAGYGMLTKKPNSGYLVCSIKFPER